MGYADVGTAAMRDRIGYGYDHGYGHDYAGFSDGSPGSSPRVGGATVGFTTPSVIYDRMRQIDDAVHSLDRDVQRNVAKIGATENFRLAWAAYVTRWNGFFERTMSFREKLLGTPFRSDEIRDQANQFALELDRFVETYKLQPAADGGSVPAPSGPRAPDILDPDHPKPRDDRSFWEKIPWWGYALGVAFAGAVGYSFYRAASHAKRREEDLFKMLPQMLPSFGGGGYGRDVPPPVTVNVAAPTPPPAPPQRTTS